MELYAKIITDDKRFERMIFLELSDCGVELVSGIDNYSKELTRKNFFTIVDLDFCREEDLSELRKSSKVIGFSHAYKTEIGPISDKCDVFLHRPFLMSELCYEIFSYDESENTDITGRIQKNRVQKMPIGEKKSYLSVHADEKSAVIGSEKISLTDSELIILSYLCERRGETVSREQLSSLLGSSEGNICDVYICMLRKKIDNRFGVKFIYTVRGKGYMIR